MMRAQIRNELSAATIEINQSWQKPELVALYIKMQSESYRPTPEETRLLDLNVAATFRMWENMHYQNRIGMYDDSEVSANREIWTNAVRDNNLYREYWTRSRKQFADAFQSEIDTIVGLANQ